MGIVLKRNLILVAAILSTSQVNANALNGCLSHFLKGKHPTVVKSSKITNAYTEICFSNFAVNYSHLAKAPNWSAEFVTPQGLAQAKGMKREDNFHEESRIPEKYRSLLSDFRQSGYDRGHLSPNGNRINKIDQYESFSLANIIPQSSYANQNGWREIEEGIRTLVTKHRQPVYIITGTLYLDSKNQRKIGKSKVYVPSHIYKAIYFPNANIASAYVMVNDDTQQKDVVSLSQLQSYTGIVLFPSLMNEYASSRRYDLPYSANAAYKLKTINISSVQTSTIFSVMPNQNALPPLRPIKEIKERISQVSIPKIDKNAIKREIKVLDGIW